MIFFSRVKRCLSVFIASVSIAVSVQAAEAGFEITKEADAAKYLKFTQNQWQIDGGEIRSKNGIKEMFEFQFGTADWKAGEICFQLKRLNVSPKDQHFGILFGKNNSVRVFSRGDSLTALVDGANNLIGKFPKPLPIGEDGAWSSFQITVKKRTMRVRFDGKPLGELSLPADFSGPMKFYVYHLDAAIRNLTVKYSKEKALKPDYLFDTPEAFSGWEKTAQMTTEPAADSLILKGNGADAKITRRISLKKGDYLVTATGQGDIRIQLVKNGTPEDLLFNLDLSSKDNWRTDWRPLQIKEDTDLRIVVSTLKADGAVSKIKYLKIERAEEPEATDFPSAEALAAQRPVPEMVRGCTMPNGKDFPDIKKLHANVTRKWVYLVERSAADPAAYDKIMIDVEDYLKAARKAGIKVVLTLGGGAFGAKVNQKEYWTDPALAGKAAALWKRIAERFLPYRDTIYAYDLCNEPLDWSQMPNAPRQWRDVATEIVKAIRTVDTETWVMYEPGPGGLCWGFSKLTPLPDTRVIYSFHYYNPHEFTHQGVNNTKGTDLAKAMKELNVRYPGKVNGLYWNKAQIRKELQRVVEFQKKYRVPILVGEFSVIRWAPKNDAVQYLKDLISLFEEYQWSWIYHGFRENPCWSVEHDETVGTVNEGPPMATYETERAKVLKAGLKKNIEKKYGFGIFPSGAREKQNGSN